jgi:phage shock protein A
VANIFVAASATWNGKALKKAKQDVGVFDKQVKRLGGTLAAAFSTRAIIRFGKEAVKAFMADEKAAKSLEQQLKNTGFQFSSPAVELYIANLQKATGVLDDELRPAFQQLLTVTGSITTSQEALNTAMNVSAATGKSLSQVTTALSRAYAGNTTGLSRLGAGLDKALLKAGDMDAIMAELNNKFSGQAAARLETYAGKMDLLKVASENVKEEIGKGILDALTLLSRDTSIQSATSSMEDFGTSIGDAIYGMAKLIKRVEDLGVVSKSGGLANLLLSLQPGGRVGKLAFDALSKSGVRPRELPANEQRSAGRITAQQFRIEVKQKKELDRLRAAEIAKLKEKTNLDKLKDQFDVERIGLTKALNEATDEETKLRIKAQLAILDNNEALAKKILEELKAADAAKKLGDALEASADKYDKMISGLIGQFRALGLSLQESMALAGMSARYQAQADAFAAGRGGGSGGGAPLSTDPYDILIRQLAPELNTSYGLSPQEAISLATMSARYQAQADAITLRIDASGDKMSQAIAESIQQATRNGYSTSGAGQLP